MTTTHQNTIYDLNYNFSDKIFSIYLESLKTTPDSISEEIIKKMIVLLKQDFLDGVVDLSEVSSVAHELWNISINELASNDENLVNHLYDASELAFRHSKYLEKLIAKQDMDDDLFPSMLRKFVGYQY